MSDWTTTSIAPRYLAELLDAAGRPPDELLARAGVTRAELATPDCRMPLAEFRELWAMAAAVQPDIGISLVERFPPGQMHMAAHLAMRSATVGDAIGDVCRYVSVATSAADHLVLTQNAGRALYEYQYLGPPPANPWMAEHFLSMAVVFLARSSGRALPVRAVAFAAPMQGPLQAYRQRFGVEPRFDAGSNVLEFDSDALAWPLLTHDAYLHAILERVAQKRGTAAPPTVLDLARREIAGSLLKGTALPLDEVAARCRLSPRALRDRLAKAHTTFRQLLDGVRRDLCREHLARGLSVNETAYLLAFSEPAALQHACRRWFGVSAGEVRRRAIDGEPEDQAET